MMMEKGGQRGNVRMAYQKTKGMAFRVLKTNRSAGVLQRVYAGTQKKARSYAGLRIFITFTCRLMPDVKSFPLNRRRWFT